MIISEKENYQKVKKIFNKAIELKNSERELYLKDVCGEDAFLLTEVRKMLAADAQAEELEKAVEIRISREISNYQQEKRASLIGQELEGRYLIQSKLGDGSFGVTYVASDKKLHSRTVVIKVLTPKPDLGSKVSWARKKFAEEVEALSRINHSGVVGILDTGTTSDAEPFLVMEFVNGVTLRSEMKKYGAMKLERVADLIRQIGQALAFAHQKGIYHRDLKPENIMIETLAGKEQIKIIDFGIASIRKSADETGHLTVVAGTLPYMAPEHFRGEVTASGDIYSLAIIAYEMITGYLPFFVSKKIAIKQAIAQLLGQQEEGLIKKISENSSLLPIEAQADLLKALSFDPSKRHKTIEEFSKNLAENLTTEASLETQIVAFNVKFYSIFKLVTLIVLVSVLAFLCFNPLASSNFRREPEAVSVQKSISYWGQLQQYRNGKPTGLPIRLTGGVSGETYFKSGDTLQFFLTPSSNGSLYLINEAMRSQENTYTLLFPSRSVNGGSSQVIANRQVETAECEFDKVSGKEKVWIIWSPKPLKILEDAISKLSYEKSYIELTEKKQKNFLSGFLAENYDANLKVELDRREELVKLQGRRETIVYLLKLNHLEK